MIPEMNHTLETGKLTPLQSKFSNASSFLKAASRRNEETVSTTEPYKSAMMDFWYMCD